MNKQEIKEKPHYLGHRMRLKERFLKDEGKSMADYELLELLLTIAIPRRDVKQKAKDLINHFGSFNKVITASQNALLSYGLSQNVITILKIIKTSAIKLSWQELNEQDEPILNNFDYMIDYCRTAMSYLDIEEFRVIFLDAKLRIIKEETMQRGSVNSVSVHPREVLKAAIQHNATSVILVHNHPSGKPQPSTKDIEVTKQIIDALKTIDIKVNDHIIITQNSYYSFLEEGILNRLNT